MEGTKSEYVAADRGEATTVLNEFAGFFADESSRRLVTMLNLILACSWHMALILQAQFLIPCLRLICYPDSKRSMDALALELLNYQCKPISDLIGERVKTKKHA